MAATSQQQAEMASLTDYATNLGAERNDNGAMPFFGEFKFHGFTIAVYHLERDESRPFWVRLFDGDIATGDHLHDVRAGDLSSAEDAIGFLIHCRNRFDPTDK